MYLSIDTLVNSLLNNVCRWICTQDYIDNKTRLLTVADLDELYGTIVPAPPGFMVFEVCIPSAAKAADELVCLDLKPVIAFRIFAPADRPVPINAAGAVSTSVGWTYAVRAPEGRWIGPDDDYERVADFKRACEQQLAEKIACRPRSAA